MTKILKSNIEKFFNKKRPEDKIKIAHLHSLYNILDIKNNETNSEWIDIKDIAYIIYRLCDKQFLMQQELNYQKDKPKNIIKTIQYSEPELSRLKLLVKNYENYLNLPWYKKIFIKLKMSNNSLGV